jgi:putative copper resistance protein D
MVTALIFTRAVQFAASMLLAGTFTFDLVTLGSTDRSVSNDLNHVERRLIRLALWSLVTALFSALFWFWLEVASMSELSLKNALWPAAWGTVLCETQFGRVWQLRLGLIAAAFVVALVALRVGQIKARRALIVVLWLISGVLLISLAWISHAAAATVHPFGASGDVLHLCAAGLWIGGLVPLAIFLARVHGSFSLGETVVRVVRRFSTLSLSCVTVLVVSGISNSWLLVGSVHALFTTPYGRLLLVKLTLFGILLSFGARNRFLVKTKLPNILADPDLLSQLRWNVLCEIYLGVAVVVIVACLGVTPPAISMMHTMR